MILGKKIEHWIKEYPLLNDIINIKEVFWFNPKYDLDKNMNDFRLSINDIKDTDRRLKRFAPYIKDVFPETQNNNGLIESELNIINSTKEVLNDKYHTDIKGDLYVKRDDSLPIAGSIKARGGIYEVLKYAEDLALKENLIKKEDNYIKFKNNKFKKCFSKYSLAVGSTGNLGLSIGIMGSKLGFKTTVHMSNDAKEWKKNLLRKKGVIVKEYDSDYSLAVKKGRKESKSNPNAYFIDDERSKNLFLGYAVAALRLKEQFNNSNIIIDQNNPLFVYLPCGVGGGPGGICFGLKAVFGQNVHCFFAEPTHSPAMLIGMLTEKHDKISVQDFGIDNITQADGLAVGRPSKFVGKMMENILSGIYTVQDDNLFELLKIIYENEKIKLEPSALAGFYGPVSMMKYKNKDKFFNNLNLSDYSKIDNLVWATGGSMVPDNIFGEYLK